jgi:DNA primase catalytic subunit
MEENKKEPTKEASREVSQKEERIRKIIMLYYSRQDIRKVLFEFSKNRECVPRYFEGFGKRPDTFQFDSDILELVKKGATSFHCSEELWQDPLNLTLSMSSEEQKQLRIGWDLLIDVDSKYIDFSKIYAELVIQALKSHGVKNFGIKFSGSKGWHIIVPSKAFPKEISGKITREMFPEWPRLICAYINSQISSRLKERISEISENKKDLLEVYCIKCNNKPENKTRISFTCPFCKTKIQNILEVFERKRKIRCPNCQIEMIEQEKIDLQFCNNCKIDSIKNPQNFKERVQSKHIDADIILVSPRHLFRMPYSLHEKTSLASVVISEEELKDFDMLRDANPITIKPKPFIKECEEGEASGLLRAALEFKIPEDKIVPDYNKSTEEFGNKVYKDFILKNFSHSLFPPVIQKILEGIKSDGRKRALFILLSFFNSLKMPIEQIAKEIQEWNKKNYEPLREGYVKSQIIWYERQKTKKLPPNFDKPYYKDLGFPPSQEELKYKNPVNYTIKKSFGR